MSLKRRALRGSRVHHELTSRGYGAVPICAPGRRQRKASQGLSRREFLGRGAAAGLALALPPLLAACGGSDEATPAADTETRTLFFNLAHEDFAKTTHVLHVRGHRFPLTRVRDNPAVLQQARQSNEFLRALADDQITHHVEGAVLSTAAPTLVYVSSSEDPAAGTWVMSGMYFIAPPAAISAAFAHARARAAAGALAPSLKRRKYGVRAAAAEQDLHEEAVLFDTTDHASALVGLHPDLLSMEPTSFGIVKNHVDADSNTEFLAGALAQLGPAMPQQSPGQLNPSGWATLTPLMDDTKTPPVPFKKSDGKLNQYYPDWHPEVDQLTAPAVGAVHPLIKDDEGDPATNTPGLGVDITGYNLNDPNHPVPAALVTGKLWARHDGVSHVDQSVLAAQGATDAWTFKLQSPDTGLYVTSPTVTPLGDGRTQVTLNNVSNWFLRYLGMWVQFLDPNGQVIPVSQLPSDTFPSEPGTHPTGLDKAEALFLGVVPPALAVLGIPVYPGQFSPAIKIPKEAATLRILYAGIGTSGSLPANPGEIVGVGAGMTAAFNYGVVGLFMAAGVSTYGPFFKLVMSLGGGAVAAFVASLIGGLINDSNFAKGLLSFSMGFLKVLYQTGLSKVATELVAAIAAALAAANFIDEIPVAGQIARAAAAVIGGIQLAETSIEVGISPAVYDFELVGTHDLAINILPDPTNTTFPQLLPGYTLYYKVSYLFDNGTAHVRDAVDVPDQSVKSIAVSFAGIPRGGKVNISIGFYARTSTTPPGQNDWCAGKGSTGLIDNTLDQAPDLAITQIKLPIVAATVYVHTSKTALDASGKHVWANDPDGSHAPPYTAPPGGQQPGLGDFRSITVRQGTSNPARAGYVGYAWNAYSAGVNGCKVASPGQLDQMANLNTDRGAGGANAQVGYASGPPSASSAACGLPAGTRLAYSLLTSDAVNFYLDSDSLHVRPVQLGGTPGFSGPAAGQSFGQLNFDSTRLLLHPAGHIVSINNAQHKIEALKLPGTALSDADAARYFLARSYSGQGTRPGLITSPEAAAISPEGVVLVLEGSSGNNRIQAFDLHGNPVQFFKQQKKPYWLQLDATAGSTYLDLAVEFTGFLYVLSRDANQVHRLDIYHPSQADTQPICTTMNMNAAKLAVDFWRSVYTLNYEVLQLPNGGGIPPFTEPSVSLWLPPPPVV